MFSSTWSNDGTIWPVGTRRSSCDFGLFLVSSKNLQTRRPPLKVITIQSISTRYQIDRYIYIIYIWNIDRYQWYIYIYILYTIYNICTDIDIRFHIYTVIDRYQKEKKDHRCNSFYLLIIPRGYPVTILPRLSSSSSGVILVVALGRLGDDTWEHLRIWTWDHQSSHVLAKEWTTTVAKEQNCRK